MDHLAQFYRRRCNYTCHQIIRHGLWFKEVANGRAYGHGQFMIFLIHGFFTNCHLGVYFAKDGSVSMGSYARGSPSTWKNSKISPICCVAVAEIVNQPHKFVSQSPFYVVADTSWIIW